MPDEATLIPWTFWCTIAVIFSKEDRARKSLSHLMSSEMLAVELPMAGSVWVELELVNVAYLSSLRGMEVVWLVVYVLP